MKTIGILGGGQLAKMTALEAQRMGVRVRVLDHTPGCPASAVAEQQLGRVDSEKDVLSFARGCDVLTVDVENVSAQGLKRLSSSLKVVPNPEAIETIQDKFVQKTVLKEAGIPMPSFWEVRSDEDLRDRLPLVQKSRKGGYDGRGVAVMREVSDLERAIKGPSYAEEFVEIDKELAVIVVRDEGGSCAVYPVVEMTFDERFKLMSTLVAPARVSRDIASEAEEIAKRSVEALKGVGVFGVELFLDRRGRVLLNELAPRPHNSGHYTIEACLSSQFEQLVRVCCGWPLGSTRMTSLAATWNLVSEPGHYGKPLFVGLEEVLSMEGVYVHIYGKKEVFPFRKMGHVTVLADSYEELDQKLNRVKETLKVKGSVNR